MGCKLPAAAKVVFYTQCVEQSVQHTELKRIVLKDTGEPTSRV